jgi:hypothetical protein
MTKKEIERVREYVCRTWCTSKPETRGGHYCTDACCGVRINLTTISDQCATEAERQEN